MQERQLCESERKNILMVLFWQLHDTRQLAKNRALKRDTLLKSMANKCNVKQEAADNKTRFGKS
jgi:hypothetical protein